MFAPCERLKASPPMEVKREFLSSSIGGLFISDAEGTAMRKYLATAIYILAFVCVLCAPIARAQTTVIFITSGTSWTIPNDWNSANNQIEVIGGGGNGVKSGSFFNPGAGGGGGAYSKVTNVTLTAGATVGI